MRGMEWGVYRLTLAAIDERLQRVKPLCYPLKLSFYWSSERHSELSPPRNTVKMVHPKFLYLKSIALATQVHVAVV